MSNESGITRAGELDWSNFGVPFPYDLEKQARVLANRLQNKENLSDDELSGLQRYTENKIKLAHLADNDPISYGWKLKCWEMVEKYWKKADVLLIGGGQRCLGPDQLIYDPVLKVYRKVKDIKGEHHVYSVDSGGKVVISEAGQPFQKDIGTIYRIALSNGEMIEVADTHLLYTPIGWLSASALTIGCSLNHFQIPDVSYREDHALDVHHSIGRALNSQSYCQILSRLSDVQLRLLLRVVLDVVPSLDDAPRHILDGDNTDRLTLFCAFRLLSGRLDDLVGRLLHNPGGFSYDRQTNLDVFPLANAHREDVGVEYDVSDRRDISRARFGQELRQLLSEFSPQLRPDIESVLTDLLYNVVINNVVSYDFVIVTNIEVVGIDVKYDFNVANNFNYLISGVLNHNSSKSVLGGRIVVELAKQKPEAKIRCFHETEDRSIEDQQTFVEKALPLQYNGIPIKDSLKAKGKNFNMGYKQGSGFVNGKLILPPLFPMQVRGSEILFNNYQQWINKKKIFEGLEADLIWGDEQMPFELFKTLLSRIPTRKGKIVLTFTMIDGFTDLVQSILGDAETIETRWSEVMQEELPIVQKSRTWPRTYIINFWSQDNPFFDFEDLRAFVEPQGREAMLTKLFGIPEKKSQCRFPKFHPDIHVVHPKDIPMVGVTRYHMMDPAGSKNYVMLWGCIDNNNDMYVYREWPNMKFNRNMNKLEGRYNGLGEWSLPGTEGQNKNKGQPGPAQKTLGLGFDGYAHIISDMENGDEPRTRKEGDDGPIQEVIFERIIDPRFGNKQVTTDNEARTMIESFRKQGLYFKGATTGKDIDVGLMAINSLFDYDQSKPLEADKNKPGGNRPKLYISSDCKNLISCLQNYTGLGGYEEYSKDFIDLLRYWVLSSPIHIPKNFKRYTGSGNAVY